MTLLNVSATPGIVPNWIGSRADETAGCACGGVVRISMRQRGTDCCLRNRYHSRSSPIIPGKSFCAIFSHSSRVFPPTVDSGNPITTVSVSSLHIIAAATEVKVLPRPISSTTCAPSISESQTYCAQTSFRAGLQLITCGMSHGPVTIGESDGHPAAWQPHQNTHVQIHWNCIEHGVQYWTGVILINDLVTILHLLLNLPSTFVWVLLVLNDLFQLLRWKLCRWAYILALLKFITMLGISQTSNHLNEYLWMEYNQFYSFNQNLH